MKTAGERKYTSTTTKLLHNLDRLAEIQEGIFRPISIQLAPTDKCNLKCVFCSVAKREMLELGLEEIKMCVGDFVDLGAKTIDLSGGGDPTLHPEINAILEYCYSKHLEVGLITNGIALHKNIDMSLVSKLSWCRVSLNSLDYVKEVKLSFPEDVVVGFSYVWNEKSSMDKLEQLKDYKERHNAKYVRIVPDCRDVKFIEKYRAEILPKIDAVGLGVFFQEKEYTPPKLCRMGYLKPFINSDGYIYHCSANPLIDLKFNPKFRMGHITNIKGIWGSIKPFTTENCGECFFKEHNELIDELMLDVVHKNFI